MLAFDAAQRKSGGEHGQESIAVDEERDTVGETDQAERVPQEVVGQLFRLGLDALADGLPLRY